MTTEFAADSAIKAEDIAHVLRDGIALLPGCRSRTGAAVLAFPSREQPVNHDHLRNVLLYLLTVTAENSRDKGIVVVIDMRGKQTWNNVRPMLKTLNLVSETVSITQVFIIKPEKFWEKQKTQMSLGSWRFEVEMVSAEALNRFVDVTQLPRVLGGSHPYDHDEWLETRIELEKWIWHVTEVMGGLDQVRKEMVESEHPVDVVTAETAVKRHANAKRRIFSIPMDSLESEAGKICERIRAPRSGAANPDLLSALPNVANLMNSLRLLKGEVFNMWDARRGELERLYQMKLFEQDAEKLLEIVRRHATAVDRSMADVGICEANVVKLAADFEEFHRAAMATEVNVSQVLTLAQRLKGPGEAKTSVDITAMRLEEEWNHLQISLKRRQTILDAARSFYVSSQRYFSELPEWTAKPGVNPADMMHQSADVMEEAIRRHDAFWVQVEEIYAQAFDDGSRVTSAMKKAEAEDTMSREATNRLQRAHKQLHDQWKDRKVLLHHMLATVAFDTDVKLVVEWLEQHGDPYLQRNRNIGENVMQARVLQKNHENFQKVASNTYENVKKLYQVYKNVTESDLMCDAEQMRASMSDLDARIKRFTTRVECRTSLLRLSVLFHTHCIELSNWFAEMRKKFEERSVDVDVETCEQNKERWVLDSDDTAQAYAVTVGEGKQLIQELQAAMQICDIDYTSSIAHIRQLVSEIDEKNVALSNEWAPQRILLQIGLRFAMFVNNSTDVLGQIKSWQEDMKEMVESETFVEKADAVQPYHKDNQAQVRIAINNIKKTAKELQQALISHEIVELQTKDGRRVMDMIREHSHLLERSEREVMKCAEETTRRIQLACEVLGCRVMARDVMAMIDREERMLIAMGIIPADCKEAENAQDDLKHFQTKIEMRLNEPIRMFFNKISELLNKEGRADRVLIVELNEMVITKYRRLKALIDERNKLLKAAIACYRTYEYGVVPILQQLAKEYSQPHKDWCEQCPSNSHQEKLAFITELISKHLEYKDRFIKGCSYAQKNGEIFLKYIQRTHVRPQERKKREEHIMWMKADLRERQSKILELWMRKKSELDRCHQFILLDASSRQLIEWLAGDGEKQLKDYQRGTPDDLEKFAEFKLQVKEQKTKTQAFLMVAGDFQDKQGNSQHMEDSERCIKQVKEKFEKFSKKVAACEVVLRGGNIPGNKDEFSLDRHSDSTIDEKMVNARREENRKMLEPMRELIKSEKDYIEDLGRCVNIYVREFDQAVAVGTIPVSLRPNRNEIFGNIERIFDFHNDKLIHELVKYEDQPEAVGASFTVWIDLLNELYTEYCVNKEQKNYLLATPDAVAYFNSVRERHSLEINNDVGSLLIKPVQRITRYRLLMEQLLKNCTGNSEELREAYEVVISVPRRVNDIIHYNCLDLKEFKSDELGPFVLQDMLTVWEPRAYFKGRGKERQVFLFELAIVFAKRLEMTPKNFKYVVKGRPLPLSEVSVVEHVEGDSSRFGLRVGTVASNDNRTDLKATSEATKLAWVRRIRELTQGLLSLNLGVGSTISLPGLGARSVSTRSTTSGDRTSQDMDSASSMGHRHSVQSTISTQSADSENQQEVWIVSEDYEPQQSGHLKVHKGDRVEIVEDESLETTDFVSVMMSEDLSRKGLIPAALLIPPESGTLPDRPDDGSNSSVSKRKSLRRIFANSSTNKGKAQTAASPATPTVQQPPANNATTSNGHQSAPLAVLSSVDPSSSSSSSGASSSTSQPQQQQAQQASSSFQDVDDSQTSDLDILPPPMQHISLNNTTMEDPAAEVDTPTTEPVEDVPVEKAAEKTPEETAIFKRKYVLLELYETEKDYVRDLASVVDGYIGNLEKMDLPADLIGKDKIIFANIAQILDFHKTCFLKEIEKCVDNYEAAGHAFVKYERRLHTLYVKYCQNKPKSDYLVSQDDFEQFFAETKASLGHKVALCDLLIKPVQRIMKYQLLLKDILKFTERAKERTDVLKKAQHVMHVVPKACDDMMQVGRLQNFDGNLGAQGRLMHQGTLQISESTAGTTQKPKDRRIFLFEQSAIIADHILPKKDFGNPNYIFKNQIMVNKMMLDTNVSDDPLKFVIKSSDPSQPTAFVAVAQTQEEKDEWVRKISEQLDQQKRLLAALVDPKRYMGGGDDGSSAMNSLNLGSGDKKAPTKCNGPAKKADSPKKETKSKLFSFGKKPAKSPTSPPPLPATASCSYRPVREDEVELEQDEKVQVLEVHNGFASIEKAQGTRGKVPSYYLELAEIPGDSLAQQIQYRRDWYAKVDETGYLQNDETFDVLTSPTGAPLQPTMVEELQDIDAVEGDDIVLSPIISSPSNFTLTWRGPGVESKRAKIETNGVCSRLSIHRVVKDDTGPYSVIARNEFGVTSSVGFLNVAETPQPPVGLEPKVVGYRQLRLKWVLEPALKYCIEYRKEGEETFMVAATNLTRSHISLRQFNANRYEFRVFAYNQRLRSDPCKVVFVDFGAC